MYIQNSNSIVLGSNKVSSSLTLYRQCLGEGLAL